MVLQVNHMMVKTSIEVNLKNQNLLHFQLKAELGRILEKPEIIKDMRGRWNLNKPKILSALRKSQGNEIHSILATIEDCTAEDESGMLIY